MNNIEVLRHKQCKNATFVFVGKERRKAGEETIQHEGRKKKKEPIQQ